MPPNLARTRRAGGDARSRSPCRRKQKSTQILPGSAKEAAAALVEKLKFEARVL